MIPKVINYVWLGGGAKPSTFNVCLESWQKFCPDYVIIEWNESNLDLDSVPYLRTLYSERCYSHISDYFRGKILYDNGGFYFDTDILLLKNIDFMTQYDMVVPIMVPGFISNAFIGASKGHKTLRRYLETLESRSNMIETKLSIAVLDTLAHGPDTMRHILRNEFGVDCWCNARQYVDDNGIVLPPQYIQTLPEYNIKHNLNKSYALHISNCSWGDLCKHLPKN